MAVARTYASFLYPGVLQRIVVAPFGQIDELHTVGHPLERPALDPQVIATGPPLYMRGWALWPQGPSLAGAVLVRIDEGVVLEATYGGARPDIAETFGSSALAAAGFDILLPTADLAPGTHQVTVVIVDDQMSSCSVLVTRSIDVANGRLRMIVDMPAGSGFDIRVDEVIAPNSSSAPSENAVRLSSSETLRIRGWAIDRDAGKVCAGLAVVVDGFEARSARYGLPRFDVAESESSDALTYCGYECSLRAEDFGPGRHTATIFAVSADGERCSWDGQTIVFEIKDARSE